MAEAHGSSLSRELHSILRALASRCGQPRQHPGHHPRLPGAAYLSPCGATCIPTCPCNAWVALRMCGSKHCVRKSAHQVRHANVQGSAQAEGGRPARRTPLLQPWPVAWENTKVNSIAMQSSTLDPRTQQTHRPKPPALTLPG